MLIFVKNEEILESNIANLEKDIIDTETLSYTKEALKRADCYFTCLSFIDFDNKTIKLVSIPNKEETTVKIEELHDKAPATLLKQVGSIEAQKDVIRQTLDLFEENYKGTFVNNPKFMRYGMRKDYLLVLQENNFPVIGTRIYDKGTTKAEMLKDAEDGKKYIIKPLTGELSNSVSFMDEIDDEWLRRKEWIVEGWVVQPFIEEIWDGEVQLRFIGNDNIYTLKKLCNNKEANANLPNQHDRQWERIEASNEMKELSLKIKSFFENDMNLGDIHYCRVDLIPTSEGIKILEFEMVNPGMGYFFLENEEKEVISNKLLDLIGV